METGFAVVTHHGLDYGLILETQAAWKTFFGKDKSYKNTFLNPSDPNMGYTGFRGEKAVGASTADLKEFYHWKPGQDLPMELASTTCRLYGILEGDIAGRLLYALKGIGSTIDYSKVCQNSNNTLLRSLYYPALAECDVQEGAVRAAAHEDINFITLLVAASAPGLEVMDKSGVWHKVPHEENSIVVNIGDCLQLASGGELKSTTHRVINPEDFTSDRVSIPLFVHPRGNTILAPGITAQQFLDERLKEIYVKNMQQMQDK
jgi:isopenicillin N synthase-like dioxygenase